MKYSFAELGQNLFSRKFGGTTIGVADPYVSGYFFIWFDKLPTALASYVTPGKAGIASNSEIKNILAASCTGVTPPGGTLNKIEFTGLGGVKWAVPGNIDYGNSLTLKFIEFNKTPILDIMHGWFKMIRDYRTGAANLTDGEDGSGLTKNTYAGLMYYWTTAPDGNSVEYYACYDGAYPTKDPQDLYAGDVENVARLDVEIEFNVDNPYHEPWVYDKCQALSDGIVASSRSVVENYGLSI